ncbi:MAG TPA: class I SAM-dependent methyltransferase, partial [Anaerolineae bacterium]|nr:class I SAM-dependent methyltransferase [Anaerolineae bacterium]
MAIDVRLTRTTQARYDRLAPVYDAMEAFIERFRFSGWRQRLWSQMRGDELRILEVGVGTGKNMPHYPPGSVVTGIDLSPEMMARARRRAGRMGIEADLRPMDVQRLDFPDDSFDAAVASFVFCSVPDPMLGLRELARVVKPGGQIVLLEHMRARN